MFSLIHLLFLSYLSCFSWDKVYTLLLPNSQCLCRIFCSPGCSAVKQYIGSHKYWDIWVTNWRRSNCRSHHTAFICLGKREYLCMCVLSKQHIDRWHWEILLMTWLIDWKEDVKVRARFSVSQFPICSGPDDERWRKVQTMMMMMMMIMVIIMIMMTMMVAHRYAIFLCSGDVEI